MSKMKHGWKWKRFCGWPFQAFRSFGRPIDHPHHHRLNLGKNENVMDKKNQFTLDPDCALTDRRCGFLHPTSQLKLNHIIFH